MFASLIAKNYARLGTLIVLGLTLLAGGCHDLLEPEAGAPGGPGIVPQALRVASTTFKEVAAGTYHTCAITTQDEAVCWGTNTNSNSPWTLPWDNWAASTEGIRVGQIAAGHDTNCAIGQDNVPYGGIYIPAGLRCWGRGGSSVPGDVITDVQQYSVGDYHACAIKTGGQLQCWAWIPADDFGDANFFEQATVPADLGPVKQVSAGGAGTETSQAFPYFSSQTCVIRMDDTVFCWGDTAWDGSLAPPADLGTVKQIEAGSMQTCAIKTDDTVACWGIFPSPPPSVGAVKQISSATGGDFALSLNAHTCVIKIDDTVVCWQWTVDDMAAAPTMIPTPADLGPVQQVSVGGHICALRMDGRIQCWNDNRFGFGALDVPDSTHVSFRPTAVMTVTTNPSFTAYFGRPGIETGTSYTVSYSEGKVVTNADTISGEDAGLTYRFVFDDSNGGHFDSGYTSSPTITVTAPPAVAAPGSAPYVEIRGFVMDASGDVGLPTAQGSSHYSVLYVTPRFFPTAVLAAPPTALRGAAFTLTLSGAEVRTTVQQNDGAFVYDTISAADAGIEYAFDCGDGAGYGAFSSTATANCTAGTVAGAQPVKGMVRDSDGDQTEYIASVDVIDPRPGKPLALVAAAASTGHITLTWSDVSANTTRLQLSRRVQTDGSWSTWHLLPAPAADDLTASDDDASGTSLNQYRLRACNADGCSAHVISRPAIAETRPAAPTGILVTVISTGNTSLSWTDASGNETSFALYRRVYEDGIWTAWDSLAAPAADATTTSDADASSSSPNQYRVQACNVVGCSRSAISARLIAEVRPAVPTALQGVIVPEGVDLSWSANSTNEQRFEVQRSTIPRVYDTIGTLGPAITTFEDTGSAAGVRNRYRVRACNDRGCSAWSATVTVITPPST